MNLEKNHEHVSLTDMFYLMGEGIKQLHQLDGMKTALQKSNYVSVDRWGSFRIQHVSIQKTCSIKIHFYKEPLKRHEERKKTNVSGFFSFLVSL